jgi:hypothetical protein
MKKLWFNIRFLGALFLSRVSKKHRNADLDFLLREISRR